MRVFFGMILGALFLTLGVYMYDSMSTSTVANGNGQFAQNRSTIVNWDVAANNWQAVKQRTHDDWIKLSSK